MLLYHYYLLAIQNWCNPSQYRIHGLWANFDATHYPTNCNQSNFSLLELNANQTLVSLMNLHWNNNCNNQTSEQLWEHEYNKHGKCITLQTGITQNEFFGKTIELFDLTKTNKNTCFDLDFQEIDCLIYSDNYSVT